MIPTTVKDNFFDRPDEIVRLADSLDYQPAEEQQYPGKRSAPFSDIDRGLHRYVGQRILKNWFHANEFSWANNLNWIADIKFQINEPTHKDQYHLKNRGWAHFDSSTKFGGIIYLNPFPEPNTGTDILQEKKGYFESVSESIDTQKKFYKDPDSVSDEEYEKAWRAMNDQWEETIRVENKYNRLMVFNSQQAHRVHTFGLNQKRLTISFFFFQLSGPNPPSSRF
tara:strand:+ start:863 stop:1534 length:672 start_codon:yes stop_codon:yes gene_type:complete